MPDKNTHLIYIYTCIPVLLLLLLLLLFFFVFVFCFFRKFILATYSTPFGRIFYRQNGGHLELHGEGGKDVSLTKIPVAEKCFKNEEISLMYLSDKYL